MAQFEIKRLIPLELFGYDVSFTNSSLFMVLALVLISTFLIFAMSGRSLVPTRMQSVAESAYEFIAGLVRSIHRRRGHALLPLDLHDLRVHSCPQHDGHDPGSFTVTSHIIVTFALAAMVWITITMVGFARHGIGFLKLFVPHGVPMFLLPLIVVIELFSYCIRPVSLSVRLFANMMAATRCEGVRHLRREPSRVCQGGPVLFAAAFTASSSSWPSFRPSSSPC